MATRGLIITLPGFNASSSSPLDQCSIHSDYPTYMINPNATTPTVSSLYSTNTVTTAGYNSGYVTMQFTSNPAAPPAIVTLITLAHGFSYIPQCLVKYAVVSQPSTLATIPPNGSGGLLPIIAGGQAVGDNIFQFDAYCDATNFYLVAQTNDAFTNFVDMKLQFKYYLFVPNGA